MKKQILLLLIILLTLSSHMHAMDNNPFFLHEATGMYYTKNNFGDIFPVWQNIPQEQLTKQLSAFVNAFKDEEKEIPFIVEVPHEKAGALDAIKKAGFTFYHGNNEKSEWIFKNNSSIPEPYTSQIGAAVLILKNDEVLVIQEKTRAHCLGLPGGTLDFNELARTSACRELKEEINLAVKSDDLKLLAVTTRVRENRFNANNTSYYYTIDYSKTSGEIIPNSNEVLRAFYVPLQDVAAGKTIDGLSICPALHAIARHLLNTKAQTHHETLLDYRQLSKKEDKRDLNDTMTIEFFAQNSN